MALQDKVFINVLLYFCNRGRENLREMTLDSFDICDEGGKCSITLKDTLTKNNRTDKLEKSQGSVMIPTTGPRCPVACFLLYKDKSNPRGKSFWQRPANAKAKRELKFDPSFSDQRHCYAPLGKNSIGDKKKIIWCRYQGLHQPLPKGNQYQYLTKCRVPR